jgi:hypothetical protein
VKKKSQVNAAKGRRYTQSEKEEILAYVDKVNAERGRGGQSAAAKKFKIAVLTISSWKRLGAGASRQVAAGGRIATKLHKLQELHDLISRTEKELARLRSQFQETKASL